jgi:hypothetical protein
VSIKRSSSKYLRIDELVPRSSVVETQELEGDAVDCVLFWEQPSVRKLRRDGITIDEPSFEEEKSDDPELSVPSRDGVVLVAGPRLKEPCPKGSVPIRRVTVQEIAEYGSLERYLTRAYPAFDAHEYAFAQQDGTVYGNEARLNIWAPYVQTSDDFQSLATLGRARFIWKYSRNRRGGMDQAIDTPAAPFCVFHE